MKIKPLESPVTELGEGVFLDVNFSMLYWVDIIGNKIYQFDLNKHQLTRVFDVDGNPSCIVTITNNNLYFLDNKGVSVLNVDTGCVERVHAHTGHCSEVSRANDGTSLIDGRLLYGTMAYKPEEMPGKIYIYDASHNSLISSQLGIHIPNTFIQTKSSIYISDSLNKKTYSLSLGSDAKSASMSIELWKDFTDEDYTPDGGCESEKGFLHIALWGGAAIGVFDDMGKQVKRINLPVLQPTNCVIYNKRWLYVTSALEGMTSTQLEKYPLSGKTIVVDLGLDYEY